MKNITATAVLYDIHGNLPALEAIIDGVNQHELDEIIVGGDVIIGPMSNECLNLLKSLSLKCHFIKGNCETAVIDFIEGNPCASLPGHIIEEIKWTAHSLSRDNIEWIRTWPMEIHKKHCHFGNLSFFHAAPGNENTIFTERTDHKILEILFQDIKSDMIITGHTHIQYDIQLSNKRLINPGSVGMSFQGPGAYYLILDENVKLLGCDYNLHDAALYFKKTNFPNKDIYIKNYILNPPIKETMLEVFKQSEWRPNTGSK